ncbi:class I SAM-dependent methyltransferase [Gluconacetobacter sp. 1b LMG 1731]|uniref:Class I SAM-dependent methyltransferase n=1 Tax=Gluconacetobacter dulcium TaxID=2729096 RepID=A0A7W4IL94_9PROT|nr:SAM-dependent methyltransferase [Gluconacetobacter dulcium]MBB2164945.1 class I SAM-dependent methyltransferase [Gluconacetobacter dulcium]MBB2193992.1 class I SAM-dependent methyltransferase [Gluconacetobacter dulcium]
MSGAAPERLDRFMARANAAYYAGRDPFADFITAPEISQMFGEILGAWVAVTWQGMGRPDPFILAEAGPGRGTLMADMTRLLARVAPDCHGAARVHLVETSPRLCDVQRAALAGRTAHPVAWHETIAALPDGPMILLANEFLDALPIRQFVRTEAGWDERFVDGVGFVTLPAVDLPEGPFDRPVPEGEILECCPDALGVARLVAARFARSVGTALFIDYGYDGALWGDTLQALRDGQPAWPLADPGLADLTAHVDFAAFARAATGAACHGSVTQGALLAELGLFARAGQLARNRSPVEAHAIQDAAQRLAAPDRMGRLFRALAVTSPGLPVPPGFAVAPAGGDAR